MCGNDSLRRQGLIVVYCKIIVSKPLLIHREDQTVGSVVLLFVLKRSQDVQETRERKVTSNSNRKKS